MKIMKMALKACLAAMILLVGMFPMSGKNIVGDNIGRNETLRYRVMYKWGLIHKKAGEVVVETDACAGKDTFTARLTGISAPWADKFYTVRDTLTGTMMKADCAPLHYEKRAREGSRYGRDILSYSRSGNTVTAQAERLVQKNVKKPSFEHLTNTLSAEGFTLDMLSSFYYMRFLDYQSMRPGDSVTMNIFSGKRKEILRITYRGTTDLKVDEDFYRCFLITFSFTAEGKTKTSDDLYAWIEDSPQRIPIKMQGDLQVGTIRCYYMP